MALDLDLAVRILCLIIVLIIIIISFELLVFRHMLRRALALAQSLGGLRGLLALLASSSIVVLIDILATIVRSEGRFDRCVIELQIVVAAIIILIIAAFALQTDHFMLGALGLGALGASIFVSSHWSVCARLVVSVRVAVR